MCAEQVKTDILDWNADHPHTNFKEVFDFLRDQGLPVVLFLLVCGLAVSCSERLGVVLLRLLFSVAPTAAPPGLLSTRNLLRRFWPRPLCCVLICCWRDEHWCRFFDLLLLFFFLQATTWRCSAATSRASTPTATARCCSSTRKRSDSRLCDCVLLLCVYVWL